MEEEAKKDRLAAPVAAVDRMHQPLGRATQSLRKALMIWDMCKPIAQPCGSTDPHVAIPVDRLDLLRAIVRIHNPKAGVVVIKEGGVLSDWLLLEP